MFHLILKWVIVTGFVATAVRLSCLDGDGNNVDWYFMYKVPKLSDSFNPLIKSGQAFFYLGEHYLNKWVMSATGMNTSHQPVHQTLEQIYTKPDPDMMFLVYNDRVLNKQKGHTKGVVAFTKTHGFWLTHSVPKFPQQVVGNRWPDSASKSGHTFLCISFPFGELENIVTQLWYQNPEIYEQQVPRYFIRKIPRLFDVTGGSSQPQSPYTNEVTLTSLQGFEFVSFAKSKDFNKDLYDGLLAPTLGVDLLVQSFQNGPGVKVPSKCKVPNDVLNIKMTKLAPGVKFSSSKDYSMWAVSTTPQWVCIADINRMENQFKRAGGALCLRSPYVWQAFKDSVNELEGCNNLASGGYHRDAHRSDEEHYMLP